MKLVQLWRHGDPVGLAETDERIRKARATIKKLRKHRVENHLGEHLGLGLAVPHTKRPR